MSHQVDLDFAADFLAEAFEKFREDLAGRHEGGVSYSYANTLWNLAIEREAKKGWKVDLNRIGEITQ